jgi:hypothetical protein
MPERAPNIYKELEGESSEIKRWRGPKEARRIVMQSRERYLQVFGSK